MLYAKAQPCSETLSKRIVLKMGDVSDILGINLDRKAIALEHHDSHDVSSDPLENQASGQQASGQWRELFLLIKNSLFEEEVDDPYDSIYESYWRQVFQQYYST